MKNHYDPPWTSSVQAPNTSHVLRELEKFTKYSIRVRAVNNNGTGPFSDAVMERTLDDGT
jgi:hypothetical protein